MKTPIAVSLLICRLRVMYPMAKAVPRQKTTTPQAGIQGSSKMVPGSAKARSQAVPAPPNPLWLMPSPMNAQRRATTKTDKVAQATDKAMAVMKGAMVANPKPEIRNKFKSGQQEKSQTSQDNGSAFLPFEFHFGFGFQI
jgi:hypothetical protein